MDDLSLPDMPAVHPSDMTITRAMQARARARQTHRAAKRNREHAAALLQQLEQLRRLRQGPSALGETPLSSS